MSYTKEELSMLSAEEREAMTEGREDAGAEEVVDTSQDGATDEAATDAAPEAVQAEAQPEAVVAEKAEADTFTHHYQVPPVEGYEEKVAEFATQKVELRRQMNEGTIDLDQYEAAKDGLVAQEMALREQKIKADISAEQNDQSSKARWQWDQEQFFGAKENSIYEDKYLLAAFDAAVRDLGGDVVNANQKGSWFLREADKMVRSRFSVAKPDAPQPKLDVRKPDLSVVPKTLGHLPAADIPQTGDVDEFAHVDRLTGLELEKAVARMSEVERERYRAAA